MRARLGFHEGLRPRIVTRECGLPLKIGGMVVKAWKPCEAALAITVAAILALALLSRASWPSSLQGKYQLAIAEGSVERLHRKGIAHQQMSYQDEEALTALIHNVEARSFLLAAKTLREEHGLPSCVEALDALSDLDQEHSLLQAHVINSIK